MEQRIGPHIYEVNGKKRRYEEAQSRTCGNGERAERLAIQGKDEECSSSGEKGDNGREEEWVQAGGRLREAKGELLEKQWGR